MTLIVADIAVAVLISPLHAFRCWLLWFSGLTLGECMRRGYKPFKLMLISSVACLISIGARFFDCAVYHGYPAGRYDVYFIGRGCP